MISSPVICSGDGLETVQEGIIVEAAEIFTHVLLPVGRTIVDGVIRDSGGVGHVGCLGDHVRVHISCLRILLVPSLYSQQNKHYTDDDKNDDTKDDTNDSTDVGLINPFC